MTNAEAQQVASLMRARGMCQTLASAETADDVLREKNRLMQANWRANHPEHYRRLNRAQQQRWRDRQKERANE